MYVFAYLIIYKAVYVLACGASGCLPGASGGGASLVPVVEVPPWCQWLPGSSPAYSQPDTYAGTHANSSARRAVSLLNQSCRVRLTDAITLIINYLGAPFGYAFTKMFDG